MVDSANSIKGVEKTSLPVVEDFYSLQGEGAHSGIPAYFIRLAGCNVCCSFCDSKETWNAANFPDVKLSELVDKVLLTNAKNVVITGGEPMLHTLDDLCKLMHKSGLFCWLETSATEPLSGTWDWICVSPKVNTTLNSDFYDKADEIKLVISNEADFEFAENCSKMFSPKALRFLQCEWNSTEKMQEKIILYIKENPQWRLSVQVHKHLHLR